MCAALACGCQPVCAPIHYIILASEARDYSARLQRAVFTCMGSCSLWLAHELWAIFPDLLHMTAPICSRSLLGAAVKIRPPKAISTRVGLTIVKSDFIYLGFCLFGWLLFLCFVCCCWLGEVCVCVCGGGVIMQLMSPNLILIRIACVCLCIREFYFFSMFNHFNSW